VETESSGEPPKAAPDWRPSLSAAEPGTAACLLGAATATAPWNAESDVRAALDQGFFAAARQDFGEGRWDATLAPGAKLAFDEATELGLDPVGGTGPRTFLF
jgi:hypothetical protein